MAPVFAVVVLAIAFPAWMPLLWEHRWWPPTNKLSSAFFAALSLFTVSEVLLLVFLYLVDRGLLTLDYSLKFAAIGIPCCMLAFVLAL